MGWLTFAKQTTPPIPSPGKAAMFVDSADGYPKYEDDTGTVHNMSGVPGPAGSSLTQKWTTIASSGGILPPIDLSLGFEVYKLTLTENITSGPTFTNPPASGVEAAPRIDVTQAASGTAWTFATPAPVNTTAGGPWVNSLTLGAKESLVLVVDSTATITKMFPSGVLG